MAPTPVDVPVNGQVTNTPSPGTSKTATIVAASIFGFAALCFIVSIIAFCFFRRAERNKLPAHARPAPYRPYRTTSPTNESLLADVASSPEDEKTSMFSRDSRSSISLYVETQHNDSTSRTSMETISLIPLHVTPVDEARDPMDRTNSTASDVSMFTRSTTSTTEGSLGLSKIAVPQEAASGELRVGKTRPRSTSTTSIRYYKATPTELSLEVPLMARTLSG